MAETLRPHAPRIAIVAIVLSCALAVALGILRTVNAEPIERASEVAGNVMLGVVFATPALLALLGVRGRPSLLVAAGALDLVLAVVTFISLIGFVFVAPAVMFFVAAARMRGERARPITSVAAMLIAVLLSTAAFFVLFAHDDPVCWATNPATGEWFRLDADRFVKGSTITMDSRDLPLGATESGCTSDTISTGEAGGSGAIVAMMIWVAWALAGPSGERVRPDPSTV